ncbi:dUTPase-like protein [Nemania abortiva]|nr:dUTPase-like protein [Nemania abortiva]
MLSGASIAKRAIIRHLQSEAYQVQPCGVDLTVRRVLRWTSAATIDLDNSSRKVADTTLIKFYRKIEKKSLGQGAYLVEFNETCSIPLDCMGQIFVRSSLWRSGVTLTAGVIDPGYEGKLGALLDVRNPIGIVLYKNAKIGQLVVHQLEEKVEGYSGIYQQSLDSAGCDEPSTESQPAHDEKPKAYRTYAWDEPS